MDGVTAQSLRQKGVDYPYNFGLSIPQLREIAAEYRDDAILSQLLMGHKTRELRLLGFMTFPRSQVDAATALELFARADTKELNDNFCFHILAEAEPFPVVVSPFIAEGTPLNFFLAGLAAITRRLLLHKPVATELYNAMFNRVNHIPLSIEVINFLFRACEEEQLRGELELLVQAWRYGDDLQHRAYAEELHETLRELYGSY